MGAIFDRITEFIKEFLISLITGSLNTMFDDVNTKVGTIAADVGQTPQAWNSSVFNLLQNLSETVIVPIAGLIITFILCYELVNMIVEKNNIHDIDTWIFFKYIFKACVAVYIVTHTFDITMAVFDLGQYIVSNSARVISGNTNIDISSAINKAGNADGPGCGAQSPLDRVAYGFPAGMDGHQLWKREPEGVPRLTIKTENRALRLKTLGNAVCPPQVYLILKCIADIETDACRNKCVFGGCDNV